MNDTKQAPSSPTRRQRVLLSLIVAGIVLALDLWSKSWVWNNLRDGTPINVIGKHLQFDFTMNYGSAFSFLAEVSWARTFFIVVTIIALIYMAWLIYNIPTQYGYGFVAVAMMAGGAAGNLHDRFVREGPNGSYGVVDFIRYNYPWGGSWPTFNIADTCLVIGTGLMIIFLYKHGSSLEKQAPSSESTEEA